MKMIKKNIIKTSPNIIIEHLKYFKANNLFYKDLLESFEITEDTTIGTAGVSYNEYSDNIVLYINPKFFNSLTFNQQIAILTHEIQHITNYHLVRGLDKDMFIYNMGADIAINQFIKYLPKGCLKPTKQMNKKESAEYYYNLLFNQKKKLNKLFNKLKSKYAKDLAKGNHNRWNEGDPNKVADAIEKAIEKSYKNGNISKKEKKQLNKAYKEIKKELSKINTRQFGKKGDKILNDVRYYEQLEPMETNWKVLIKKFIMRSFVRKKRNTIKVPNRRYNIPYGRTKAKTKHPKGIILVDISPSISRPLLNMFKTEIEKMFPLFSEMRIILVDYEIRKDFVIKSKKGFNFSIPYGNGTDLIEPFKYLNKQQDLRNYSFIIYFTDLEGDIPPKSMTPIIPTLWAVYGDYGNTDVKFGEVIKIKK